MFSIVTLKGLAIPALGGARWAHVKHVAHRAVVDGFEGWIVLRRSEVFGSVQDFGNEGLVLDEGETGGRFWSIERQFDQRQ